MEEDTWENVSNLAKLAQNKHHTQIVIFLQKLFTFVAVRQSRSQLP